MFQRLQLRAGGVREGPREDAGNAAEGLSHMHSLGVDGIFPDAAVVLRSAHLQHGDSAPHLAEGFHIAQQDDRIGDAGICASVTVEPPSREGVVEVNRPAICLSLRYDVRARTNSRKVRGVEIRSRAERLSTATRVGWNSSMCFLIRSR